jgi:CheY-like chemotaxis protein
MVKILLIDDDAPTLKLVHTLLQGHNYTVVCASSGSAGVEMAVSDETLDLIITDLSMTGVSGWDVVRAIRAHPAGTEIPILALSAYTSAQDRDGAFEAGCSAYENKPINQGRLLEKIATLLKS